MSSISDQRLKQLRGLMKSLPERLLSTLDGALQETTDKNLIEVRQITQAELEFRQVKRAIFAPYMPLCSQRRDEIEGKHFAPWILDNIWSALETQEPALFQQSRFSLRGLRPEDPTPVIFHRMITASAQLARDKPELILKGHASDADKAELAEFAHYLDLGRILRAAQLKIPEWLGRLDSDKAASLRVLYKDASDLAPESGVRFMEALFSYLEDGTMIIKLVATVCDRANDRFLSMSELNDFGERLLNFIESRIEALKLVLSGRAVLTEDSLKPAECMGLCLTVIQSIEHYIELAKDGPWGVRIGKAKTTISSMIEARLKSAEKTMTLALPTRTIRGREVACVDKQVSPENLAKAIECTEFVKETRQFATSGGFSSLHAKVLLGVERQINSYFEELIQIANMPEGEDEEKLCASFDTTTQLIESLLGSDAFALARRRVASALGAMLAKTVA